MKNIFLSQLHPTLPLNQPALWFVFKDEEILLSSANTIPYLLDLALSPADIKQQHYLGLYGSTHCHTLAVAETTQLAAGTFHPFRGSHTLVSNEDLFLLAARAKQILTWDKTTQFCGYCGAKTQPSNKERAKICPACKALFYPHLAPVALVLIQRKKEILLARSPHFPKDIYSILAGFVEPGETLEQTAIREVKEEVGINIKDLHYFGSQPWPFPSNLMIGFTAEYDRGEIVMDPEEIEDARWFPYDKLPTLPNPLSLSRRMIDNWLFNLNLI